MRAMSGSFRLKSSRTTLLVLLCVALLVFAVFVQAVHTHSDGAVHANCALCAAAHAALAIIVSVALLLTLQGFAVFFAREEKSLPCFLIPFALSIRPPPEDHLI